MIIAHDPLVEVQEVLNDLEADLEKTRAIWKDIETNDPYCLQVAEEHWKVHHARCWLHGATDVLEANELDRWLIDQPPLSDTAKSNAAKCISFWKEWLNIEGAYYEPFEEFELDAPEEDQTVFEYICRMAQLVEEGGKGARLRWRALKSFLAYLRNLSKDEIAFIEQIFPQKMDLSHGRIIRKITPEVYPIPQELASNILVELARMCRHGRPDAQLTAAESLALCWLCLTASRLRLPIYLETLKVIKFAALQHEGEFPVLLIPTLFGDRRIRISQRLAKFLHALSRIPSRKPRQTVLQRPFRSLTRMFDTALKNVAPNPDFGNITYVTLLSHPHHFGNHRPKSK